MKRSIKYPPPSGKVDGLHDEAVSPAEGEAMIRTQIYLSRPEYDFVQAEAAQRKQPMAAVIRAYIDEKMQLPDEAWLGNPMLKPTPRDPKLNLPEDAAINHDHYLYGTAKKYVKVKGQWVPANPRRAKR